jgi:methylated-DNA-[protein]-cysteine S-methyltransferase
MLEDLHHPILCEAERQLTEYFKGERTTFQLLLQFRGTEFQKRVWQQLLQIPYGQTRSYIHLARAIGSGSASRAVGFANSKNPLSIIVPCHRVVGASGKLTGFAGGIETKAALLELEGALKEHSGLFGNRGRINNMSTVTSCNNAVTRVSATLPTRLNQEANHCRNTRERRSRHG